MARERPGAARCGRRPIARGAGWISWLGKAAEAVGEPNEARTAYERAIELEEAKGEVTDAPELLADLLRRAQNG